MENPTKPLPTVQAFLLGLQYVLAMYGATIVAGLFVVLVAGIFSSLRDFFPPVVTGSLITVIGLSLTPIALQN